MKEREYEREKVKGIEREIRVPRGKHKMVTRKGY